MKTSLIITGSLLAVTIVVLAVILLLRRRAERAELRAAASGQMVDLPAPWHQLRNEVEGYNRALTRLVFERAAAVFQAYYTGSETPEALTREYARDEFLLVLDEHGQPSRPVVGMLDAYHKLARRHPAFARWFQESAIQEGDLTGAPVLLAGRWLCHLVGLRHGTVEIFIDPPNQPGYTLVQVRGMDKFESPGAFDIPCAGHITGTESVTDALRKELREELNLSLDDDLEDLQLLGRYNSFGAENASGINHEHRYLYRARLKPESASRIRFSDGEVAGLTVFSVAELRELVRKYPERVASGLSESIGMYTEIIS